MKQKNMLKIFLCLITLVFIQTNAIYSETLTFSKCYSFKAPKELLLNKKEQFLLCKKKAETPFTELILSWNASRPKKGKFVFYINIKHNDWSGFMKIAEWGKNGQKTFGNTKNKTVHIKYVRAVMQNNSLGFEYMIKVKSVGGADLKRVKALFVNVSNWNNFREQQLTKPLKSTLISGVPKQSQWWIDHYRRKDLCSPTSISMVGHYFLSKTYKRLFKTENFKKHAKLFADKVYDPSIDTKGIYGNWLFNVAQAFNTTRGKIFYRVERLNNFEQLHSYLTKKIPVAVSVRGNLPNGAWPYDKGHFLVVIGWDQKNQSVICIDSAFKDKAEIVRPYKIDHFIRAWAKSRNLGYTTSKNS